MSDVLIPRRITYQGTNEPTFPAARGVIYMRTGTTPRFFAQADAPAGTNWVEIGGDVITGLDTGDESIAVPIFKHPIYPVVFDDDDDVVCWFIYHP